MILSSHRDQNSILTSIMVLHNKNEPFEADLTYGNGSFWKLLDKPTIRADINPELPNLTHPGCDVQNLPFENESIQSIVFDPPFMHAAGADSIMGNRFGSYPSQFELHVMYRRAAWEISRVLKPDGILVWKCQDIVESGKQVWNHILVHDLATGQTAGLSAIDLFILTRGAAIPGHNHGRQVHARRNHSYWWIFRKG